jgi:hypothetical protein
MHRETLDVVRWKNDIVKIIRHPAVLSFCRFVFIDAFQLTAPADYTLRNISRHEPNKYARGWAASLSYPTNT